MVKFGVREQQHIPTGGQNNDTSREWQKGQSEIWKERCKFKCTMGLITTKKCVTRAFACLAKWIRTSDTIATWKEIQSQYDPVVTSDDDDDDWPMHGRSCHHTCGSYATLNLTPRTHTASQPAILWSITFQPLSLVSLNHKKTTPTIAPPHPPAMMCFIPSLNPCFAKIFCSIFDGVLWDEDADDSLENWALDWGVEAWVTVFSSLVILDIMWRERERLKMICWWWVGKKGTIWERIKTNCNYDEWMVRL